MFPVWYFLNGVPTIGPLAITDTQTLVIDGTQGAPAIAFASDPDTGLFTATGNTLGISAGGTQTARFNATRLWMLSDSGGIDLGASADTTISRGAANRFDIATGDSLRFVLGNVEYSNANGQLFSDVQQLTELTTIAAAATTDTTIQMPANSVVLGVSVRVTVVIPTAATMTVGDSGSAARFNTGANISVAANTTDPGTKAGAYYNASALSVRFTPNATPAANTGRVRTTIYYYTITPPTS
jgi:hypothetical protein